MSSRRLRVFSGCAGENPARGGDPHVENRALSRPFRSGLAERCSSVSLGSASGHPPVHESVTGGILPEDVQEGMRQKGGDRDAENGR
jgi:hypothetical protein